jgi:purine-nucleoside phosphorylase
MSKNLPELGRAEEVIRVVFGCRPEDVAEDVVITPFIPLNSFQRHLDAMICRLAPPFFYRGFTGIFRGRAVTVILTGVGPSRVGDCVGFLALTPARRVLFAGALGGLGPEQAIGDFFLPLEAADGEGYARYVDRPFAELAREARTLPCSGGLEHGLAAFLRARGLTLREGRVFTIGSVAFESRENLELLAELGYDALEMELSAFYAAARHHGFEAAALTYVSDLPLRSSLWEPKSPAEEEALRTAYRALPPLCLEFLSTVRPAPLHLPSS